MKTSEKILKYIEERKEVSAKEITSYLDISERAVFKQLSKLITSGKLIKIGKPPKVFYKKGWFPEIESEVKKHVNITGNKIIKVINDNFLYITPLGQYFTGKEAFLEWCNERQLDPGSQADQYYKSITKINKSRKNGMIIATDKFNKSLTDSSLKEIFYIDFYSTPQFGKTKLGQLLLYAKQTQDRKRIKEISRISENYIHKIISLYKIDAIGFIPPTIKREIQFMRELEKNLKLNLPILKITKIKTEIIVPQKTLRKLADRIVNAMNTIIVEDKRIFKNVLLIDDAIGSGATLNETSKKIIANKIASNVYGLAITGSYKGFDVISEV